MLLSSNVPYGSALALIGPYLTPPVRPRLVTYAIVSTTPLTRRARITPIPRYTSEGRYS